MKKEFSEIIALWPSISSLADDIEGVTQQAVYKWSERNSIPSKYWMVVIASARKHRIKGVTMMRLASI